MPSYYSQGNWTWRALLWLISPRQLWKGEERVKRRQQHQGKFPWFGSNFLFLLKKENPSLLLGFIWCGALVLSFQKSFLLKVPLLGPLYHFSLESSSGLLSLERSAPAGRSVVPPPKKTKNQGEGHVSPTQQNSQSPYQTQSNLTRHWSDNPQAESPWDDKYLINTKVTGPGVYEPRRCLWLSTRLEICFQPDPLFFIASYIIIILQLFWEDPKQRGL